MRKIYSADAPQGEIICHSPDGSLYRFVEPDYWQLVTPTPTPAPGSEAAFGEFKQAGHCSIKAGGITVRDYFAAKALQATQSDPVVMIMPGPKPNADKIAEYAYMIADAMLAARGESK